MVNDSNSILKIVSDFKANKWSTSKIEIDLEISNGLLGKAAKGKTKLSNEKFINLETYYIKHFVFQQLHPPKEIGKSLGDLSDKVKTANEIEPVVYEVTESNNFGFSELKPMVNNIKFEVAEWIKEVEAYCGELGILPTDLIETHRLSLKMAKNGIKQGNESKIKESPMSDFRKNLVAHKTGYREK